MNPFMSLVSNPSSPLPSYLPPPCYISPLPAGYGRNPAGYAGDSAAHYDYGRNNWCSRSCSPLPPVPDPPDIVHSYPATAWPTPFAVSAPPSLCDHTPEQPASFAAPDRRRTLPAAPDFPDSGAVSSTSYPSYPWRYSSPASTFPSSTFGLPSTAFLYQSSIPPFTPPSDRSSYSTTRATSFPFSADYKAPWPDPSEAIATYPTCSRTTYVPRHSTSKFSNFSPLDPGIISHPCLDFKLDSMDAPSTSLLQSLPTCGFGGHTSIIGGLASTSVMGSGSLGDGVPPTSGIVQNLAPISATYQSHIPFSQSQLAQRVPAVSDSYKPWGNSSNEEKGEQNVTNDVWTVPQAPRPADPTEMGSNSYMMQNCWTHQHKMPFYHMDNQLHHKFSGWGVVPPSPIENQSHYSSRSLGNNFLSLQVTHTTVPPSILSATLSHSLSASSVAITTTCNWTEHTSPEGLKYYYNSVNCESKWEKPKELTIFEQQQQKIAAPQLMEPFAYNIPFTETSFLLVDPHCQVPQETTKKEQEVGAEANQYFIMNSTIEKTTHGLETISSYDHQHQEKIEVPYQLPQLEPDYVPSHINFGVIKGRENSCCIKECIVEFAHMFKNHVSVDSGAYGDLPQLGMKMYTTAKEDTVTSEETMEVFDLASGKFQEIATLPSFYWGNIFMSRARKTMSLVEDDPEKLMSAQVKYSYGWTKEEYKKARSLSKKQNCFNDFIAASEYLISTGYTNSGRLGIEGRSNNGLLIAARINQHSNLLGCALTHVGVMDIFCFHEFTIGHAWKTDWETSSNNSIKYPCNILFTTGSTYEEAMKIESNLYEGLFTHAHPQFEQAKHTSYVAIGSKVDLNTEPSKVVLEQSALHLKTVAEELLDWRAIFWHRPWDPGNAWKDMLTLRTTSI